MGPLPLDLEILRRIARVERDAWAKAWAMLKHFFSKTQAGYTQKRLEAEKAASMENKARLEARGRAGADKRWSKQPENAKEMPKQC